MVMLLLLLMLLMQLKGQIGNLAALRVELMRQLFEELVFGVCLDLELFLECFDALLQRFDVFVALVYELFLLA